jgi:hypothetical protein
MISLGGDTDLERLTRLRPVRPRPRDRLLPDEPDADDDDEEDEEERLFLRLEERRRLEYEVEPEELLPLLELLEDPEELLEEVLELDDDDDDDDEDEEEEETDEESESSAFFAKAASFALAKMSFGAFLRNSRRSSVNGPNPMEVKKLMAYRVLRTLSLGNIPENHTFISSSSVSNRRFTLAMPIASAIS